MGISKVDFNMPNTLAFDQPGLGVGRIKPKVGEAGFGSMGPKEANPKAESLPKSCSACLKKAIVLSRVSTGVVVGKRASRRISFGPVPTAQTNFVPPPSMPPNMLLPPLQLLSERQQRDHG